MKLLDSWPESEWLPAVGITDQTFKVNVGTCKFEVAVYWKGMEGVQTEEFEWRPSDKEDSTVRKYLQSKKKRANGGFELVRLSGARSEDAKAFTEDDKEIVAVCSYISNSLKFASFRFIGSGKRKLGSRWAIAAVMSALCFYFRESALSRGADQISTAHYGIRANSEIGNTYTVQRAERLRDNDHEWQTRTYTVDDPFFSRDPRNSWKVSKETRSEQVWVKVPTHRFWTYLRGLPYIHQLSDYFDGWPATA